MLTAMMCDQGSATSARSLGPRNEAGKHRGRARAEQRAAGKRRAFGKAAGAGGVEDGDGCGGIDGRRAETARRWYRLGAQKSVQRVRLSIVSLDPGADVERLAVTDVALEDGSVGDQNLGAAVGEDAAHFGEREHAG